MDSNGPHTLINLVGVVLNATPSPVVRKGIVREFAGRAAFQGPRQGNVSVGCLYDGLPDLEHYHEGLATVLTPAFAARHAAAVAAFGGAGPAFLTVVNSGLHDLALKFDPAFFAAALPHALDVYDLLDGTAKSASAPPRVWRTTLAPAGDARTRFGNPQTVLNAVPTPLVLARGAAVARRGRVRHDLPLLLLQPLLRRQPLRRARIGQLHRLDAHSCLFNPRVRHLVARGGEPLRRRVEDVHAFSLYRQGGAIWRAAPPRHKSRYARS